MEMKGKQQIILSYFCRTRNSTMNIQQIASNFCVLAFFCVPVNLCHYQLAHFFVRVNEMHKQPRLTDTALNADLEMEFSNSTENLMSIKHEYAIFECIQ